MTRSALRTVGVNALAGLLLSSTAAAALAAPMASPTPTASPNATRAPAMPRANDLHVAAPDFDDVHLAVRATVPAGVEYRAKGADGTDLNGGQPLRNAVWEPMSGHVGVPVTIYAVSTDPALSLAGETQWTHTFMSRPTYGLEKGDEFNGTGVSTGWAVLSESWATGRSKGKSFFRPENLAVENGALKITTSRHCVTKDVEEPSAANRTDQVCPTGKETVYTAGRIFTPHALGTPRSMEVRAKLDGAHGDHNGITSTAWANNSQPFCQGGVQTSDSVELDTMEIWKKTFTHNSTHINCRDGRNQNVGARLMMPDGDLTGEWHTYRMEWDGTAIRYFFDGQPVPLWKDPTKTAVTADVALMTQEDFVRAMTQYMWRLSVYTTTNANGGWAPFVDDAAPWQAKVDEWDYVRWEPVEVKAPTCPPDAAIDGARAGAPELGEALGCARPTAQEGARAQDFEHGRIYDTPASGPVVLSGEFWSRFGTGGGEAGLGLPTAPRASDGPAATQAFANGVIMVWPDRSRVVRDEIWRKWVSLNGLLGNPVADEHCGLRDGGCSQRFERGTIFWSGDSGAHFVRGPILDRYAALGWENSAIGYPVTDEMCGLRDGGCVQRFQRENGHIYWSAATDAHSIQGAIYDRYASMGWENGPFGYPVSDEFCGLRDGGCGQRFQHESGHIYWAPAAGTHSIQGLIYQRFAEMGWENGVLGYPVSDEFCGLRDGGCGQRFQHQNGHIYWSAASGAHNVQGEIFRRYAAMGWENGAFGYPVTNELCGLRDGGCVQRFQHESGHIYWSQSTGSWSVQGAIYTHYAANRWEMGRFAYPTGPEQCVNLPDARECTQAFRGGQIVWNSRIGTRSLP
ncbi:family 16 glycosylhydrolase [Mariniluteicoccus flavus]